jgi:hypothetical protein
MEFDVKVRLLPDDKERAELIQSMNIALQSGAITYEQAFKIKHIDDIKLAELYLSKSMKRAKKEAMESAQQNSQMNAQIQQQSAQLKMEQDAQILQMESQGKIAINQSKGAADKEIELLRFASQMYSSSFSSGVELPENIKQMVDTILGSAIQEKMQLMQAEAQQVSQQAEAQKQAVEGQQTEEEQGQEEEIGKEEEVIEENNQEQMS